MTEDVSTRSRGIVVGGYLTSYMLDRAGDGLFYVALGWLATRASGELGAATILAAGSIPRVAMLLFGGALGDRWGLLRTARGTLVLRCALMVIFALIALPASPSGILLAVVAAAFGLVDALHSPALTGLSGVLLRGPAVVRAQGLMTSIGNTVEVVAGPLGGLLLVWRGDAVGWLGAGLSVLALAALPGRRHESAPRETASPKHQTSVPAEVAQVLRGAMRDPELRAMLSVFAIANFCATPAIVAGIPLLADLRGWSAPQYGTLMAAFAAGSVAGGAVLAAWGHRMSHPARWSAVSMLPGAALLSVVGLSENVVVVGSAVAGAGAAFAGGAGALMGTIKSTTAPEMMGRTMSLIQVAVYVLIPAGLLVFGAAAEASSAQTAEVGMAVLMAAGAVVALTVGPLRSMTVSRTA